MEITDIIQQHPLYIAIALFFAAIGLAIQTFKQTIMFYEDFIVSRNLKRIENMSKVVSSDSQIKDYLERIKENEVFRLTSGVNTNGQGSRILMQLIIEGFCNKKELKKIYPYVGSDKTQKITITIPFSQQFLIAYSFVASLYVLFVGLILGLSLTSNGDYKQLIIGTIVIMSFALIGRFLSKDYRTYRMLSLLKDELLKVEKLSNNNHWENSFWSKPIDNFIGKFKNS